MGSDREPRVVIPWNALAPIVVNPLGNASAVRAVDLKTLSPIVSLFVVKSPEKVSDESPVAPLKASLPIAVTVCGITTVFKPMKLEKAEAGIAVRSDGRTRVTAGEGDVTPDPENTLLPRDVIPAGNVNVPVSFDKPANALIPITRPGAENVAEPKSTVVRPDNPLNAPAAMLRPPAKVDPVKVIVVRILAPPKAPEDIAVTVLGIDTEVKRERP